MNPLKNGQLSEEDLYMWGCGGAAPPHIPLLDSRVYIFLVHARDEICLMIAFY
jgi:hypothetical protein